jgi:oligopeptide transport system permease protein
MKEPYIEAALSLGMGARRLLFKHLLPNVLALVVLSALITLPRAILTEATLSFLGLGMAPPLSSWGTLASEGWTLLPVAGYVLWLPAGLMVTTLIALNTLGEALKQRLLR